MSDIQEIMFQKNVIVFQKKIYIFASSKLQVVKNEQRKDVVPHNKEIWFAYI
jgi:hypothetical protein